MQTVQSLIRRRVLFANVLLEMLDINGLMVKSSCWFRLVSQLLSDQGFRALATVESEPYTIGNSTLVYGTKPTFHGPLNMLLLCSSWAF